MMLRSMNAPGSPSSALQTTYLGSPGERLVSSHLRPVGNPAPPRPRSPEAFISERTSWGDISASALVRAAYPSRAMYSRRSSGSIMPQLRKAMRICLA
jgi:hypothetical protein